MITKFKIFEGGIYTGGIIVDNDGKKHENLKKLLCIDNRIGSLTDTYNLTIGNNYDVKYYGKWWLIITDDKGDDIYFDDYNVLKNFSTEKSYDDYLIKQNTKKYNL